MKFRRLKPRILKDVKSPSLKGPGDVFSPLTGRLNLSYKTRIKFEWVALLRFLAAVGAVIFMVFGSAAAPTIATLAAADSDQSNGAERQALEEELKRLESQIDQYEDQIVGYQKQGKTLKGEITKLDSKVAKLNLQIKAIKLSINQLDQKIDETEYQITTTRNNIETNKKSLSGILRDLYQSEQSSLMEIFLKSSKISDFFNDLNDLTLLQGSLQTTIQKIADLQGQLEDQKDQLSLARADKSALKEYQEAQKGETEKAKGEKNNLLTVTKGQESKYQTLLKETKKTAAEIRSRIFKLLGGGELSFEEAYKFSKLASQSTGVDAALILAVLDRESALGRNVGRCSYKAAMNPKRDVPAFLEILKGLKIDPESTAALVSCANKDGAYGGAMGPAQFIPSTWKLYSEEVSKITGSNPASPWNNADAFVATALYLEDALVQCSSYSNKTSQERCAAARYYAGGNWKRHLWTYGEATISKAVKFREDIATITS